MNFPSSLNALWRGKRFNPFNRALRDVFSARVYGVGLGLDFTCHNRDGTGAAGGWIHCNNVSPTPQAYRLHMTAKTREQRLCARLDVDGIKPHNFQVTKGTVLENYYDWGQVPLLAGMVMLRW